MANATLRYIYLHGFTSSPRASKGIHLTRWFQQELNISLDIPDLNIPSFRQQTLSKIVDHVGEYITRENNNNTMIHTFCI
jgi:predicted esterase YcpF (UPF0227 family)